MKKILCFVVGIFCITGSAIADLTANPSVKPSYVSVFSTSSDWEAVTGLRFSEYTLEFVRSRAINGRGTEIYFLDEFPCVGQASDVRQWISAKRTKTSAADMRITCLVAPESVKFAWRDAGMDDAQGRTTGMMECETRGRGNTLVIDLADCDTDITWDKLKKQ
ncbi:MAG: hypothetical protein LBL75_00880 [Rickettsiales bacterium]|jgi:hypothetical protein|nr:hypothetical protein [Rickettsiales bacterium]